MFAHIDNSTIIDVRGSLPRAARNPEGEWVCPPDGAWATAQHEACGWYEVSETPAPADTVTSTFDGDVQLVDGAPVLVWTVRDKTDEELLLAARVTSLEDRVDAIEAIVLDRPDPDEAETPVWSSPCPPNAVRRWPDENGDRLRNVSGAWLVATPDEYPIGYVNLDVGQVDEWAAGVAYTVGDQVTYLGLTYQCAQAHQSQAGWTPVAVPALWVLVS